jgi:Arc/MetJ-type ribon-helix-helix transcriptional regulator
MTIQVTVRLPDDLVSFMDEEVAAEHARSRADVVARALRRLRRHHVALKDAEIYALTEPDEDMLAIVEYTGSHPVRLDD